MKLIYIYSIYAKKYEIGRALTKNGAGVLAIDDTPQAEYAAQGYALQQAYDSYPREDGWTDHSAYVSQVPVEYLAAAGYHADTD